MRSIILSRWKDSVFLKNVLVLMSGSVIAQGIVIGSIPFVTRIYSPDSMGVLSLVLAFFGVWMPLACLRYDSAIFIADSEEEVTALIFLSYFLATMMGLLSCILLFIFMKFDLIGFGLIPDDYLLWIASIALLLGYYTASRSYNLRENNFNQVGKSMVARALVQTGGRIGFGLAGFAVFGLIISELLGIFVSVVLLATSIKTILKKGVSIGIWKIFNISKSAALKFKRFSLIEFPSVLIDQLAIHAPIPIIAAMYGAKAAGIYSVTRLMILIPGGQISKAVGDAAQAKIAALIRQNSYEKAEILFYKLLKILSIMAVLPMLLLMVFAPMYTGALLGEKWSDAGMIAAAIAPWMFGAFVVGSLSRIISLLERQELKLFYDVFSLAMVLIATVVAYFAGLGFYWLVILFSIYGFIGYGVYLYLIIYSLKEANRKGQLCVG